MAARLDADPPQVGIAATYDYVDAEEADVRRWFGERFIRLTDSVREDAESFDRGFVDMATDQLRSLAEVT
ncbi:MAG: hypothetical protein WD646_02040 [Actinomycetota bacterium]